MNRPSTPRKLVELRNVIALVREASVILDCDENLRKDQEINHLADRTYDLLQDLRAKLESTYTELGWGWTVSPTVEITNIVEVNRRTLDEINTALENCK